MNDQDKEILALERKVQLYRDALRELATSIEVLFEHDWSHTVSWIQSMDEKTNFLDTGQSLIADGNNWGNRPHFLRYYYNAVQILELFGDNKEESSFVM